MLYSILKRTSPSKLATERNHIRIYEREKLRELCLVLVRIRQDTHVIFIRFQWKDNSRWLLTIFNLKYLYLNLCMTWTCYRLRVKFYITSQDFHLKIVRRILAHIEQCERKRSKQKSTFLVKNCHPEPFVIRFFYIMVCYASHSVIVVISVWHLNE